MHAFVYFFKLSEAVSYKTEILILALLLFHGVFLSLSSIPESFTQNGVKQKKIILKVNT